MADEAIVKSHLSITKGNLKYRATETEFRADVTGTKGPVPGALTITTEGEDVSFAELTTPGYCLIRNLDATNFVEGGIWDGLEFIPLFEVLPGEQYVLRFSRNLNQSFGTGTGTTDSGNTFRLKADTASCNVSVEAFEA